MKFDVPQQMDGYDLLWSIDSGTASLVVLDCQYRGILDKLSYGNEGERQSERSALPQMSDMDVCNFVSESERILMPSSHLFFWCDKYMIGSGRHLKYFDFAPSLRIVDLISWNKGRIGNGYRTRNATEYLVIAQKEPIRAKGIWTDHGIPDSWTEKKTVPHPHSKPVKLTRRLIEATTEPGSLVVDPCAGSFMVLDICRETGRRFLGCDLRALPGEARGEARSAGGASEHSGAANGRTAPAALPVAQRTESGPNPVSLLAKLRQITGRSRGIPRLTAEAVDGE